MPHHHHHFAGKGHRKKAKVLTPIKRMRGVSLLLLICTVTVASILGIDLGNDFTKAALVAPRMPFEIVMSADSKRKDVSGLALKPLFNDGIERLYGSQTSSHCTRFPKQCLLNYKPLLGKPADDAVVQRYLKSHPGVSINPSQNNRNTISFEVEDHQYPIEEVLAMNLGNIKARASSLLQEKVPGGYSQIQDVAIAVPSFFKQSQRLAILDAAELAGLNVVALIDDGVAIATNYATNNELADDTKEYHIVYDMGAGSTKATLVSFTKLNDSIPLSIEVHGYAFDETLGGGYFTNVVAELIRSKFLKNHKQIRSDKFQSNERSVAKLFQAAEKAKLVLSANNEAHVSIESLYEDIDFKTKVTREEFEDFISDSIPSITQPLKDVLKQAGLSIKDMTSVIYAGGSTRVPFVQRHLQSFIGEDLISKTINADEAAVFGATLRGVQISKVFRAKEFNVTERSPYEYSVSFDDDSEVVIFPQGSSYGQEFTLDVTDKLSDSFGIDLIEDLKRIVRYEPVGKLADIVEKLKFNISDCADEVKYVANFKLSQSRIVELESLSAQCTASMGLFEKLKGTFDSNEDIKLTSKIAIKPKYLSSRPLGSATKQDLKLHLLNLANADKQRKSEAEKLNELEAALYSARSYFTDDDVVEQIAEDVLDHANALVSDLLDWLDYESDGASIKTIKGKLNEVKKIRDEIEGEIAKLSVPLDLDEFKKVYDRGVKAVNKFQDSLLTLKDITMNLSVEFAKIGLDFDEEFSKLKLPELISEDKFNRVQKSIDSALEEVKNLIEKGENKFESVSRDDKLEVMIEANEKLNGLEKLEENIASKFARAHRGLKEIYNKRIRSLKRKAAKEEKKRQEMAEEEGKEASTEEDEAEDDIEEQQQEEVIQETPVDTPIDEETTETVSKQKETVEHDEL